MPTRPPESPQQRSSPDPRWQAHVESYAQSHRTRINKLLHFLGIPLIAIALLGLLSKLSVNAEEVMPALRPNAAWVAMLGVGLWYVWLDWKMAILPIMLLVGCYVIGSLLSAGLLAVLLGTGAVAHLVGHFGF